MARTKQKPRLPVQQLIILVICRFAEPIAATSIHPYLPEMIQSFGVPIKEVARYAGRLGATFSLTACVAAILWGRASDQLGRKPMILLALTCLMLANISFGFSTSLKMAFASRMMQGFASGDVGIIRTAVAEMVPQRELQPQAFAIMPLVWVTGVIVGPIIGGNLVRPVERFGGIFTKISFLKTHPYALPNLITSVLFVIGIASGFLFLKETHQDKKDRKDYGLVLGKMITGSCQQRKRGHVSKPTHAGEVEPLLHRPEKAADELDRDTKTSNTVSQQSVPLREVLTQQSCLNLMAYAGMSMHTIAFYQLLPVFMNYPRDEHHQGLLHNPLKFTGGYGMKSHQIGIMFTAYGIVGMIVQLLVFPPITRKYGALLCLKVCAIALPLTYFLMPFTSLIKSTQTQQAIGLILMLAKCIGGVFGFPCTTILMTNSASSLRNLGALNGIATSLSALGQAAGPALGGFAFTYGVHNGYIVIPFWVVTFVAVLSAIPVWWLEESAGFASDEEENEDEDEDEAEESIIVH